MSGPQFDEEELLMELQDVLTMVAAGRTDGHKCPFGQDVTLDCQDDDGWARVRCPSCNCGRGGLKFDGLLG